VARDFSNANAKVCILKITCKTLFYFFDILNIETAVQSQQASAKLVEMFEEFSFWC